MKTMFSSVSVALALAALKLVPRVSGHASFWDKSMLGFNVTQQTFSYDNRPVVPLMNMPFSQWWMHGYLDYLPHPEDVFELPAGGAVDTYISCDKGATPFYESSDGGLAGYSPTEDDVCPGQPMSEYHTTGIDDLKGCALAIAYNDVAANVQPEDFVVFSVNYTCVWTLHTSFSIPAELPPCPNGKCTCIWTWIHAADAGSEQMYQTPFMCNVTGATNTEPLGQPMLPRRCGADPANGRPDPTPGNCTIGPKWPYYWYQAERNNMFEGTYSPPEYTPMYDWVDGAQPNLLIDAYISSLGPGSGPSGTPVAPPATSSVAATSPAAPPPPATTPAPPASTPAPPVNTPTPQPPPPASSKIITSVVSSASQSSFVHPSVSSTASAASATNTKKCKPRPSASSNTKRDALAHHRRHARDHTLH